MFSAIKFTKSFAVVALDISASLDSPITLGTCASCRHCDGPRIEAEWRAIPHIAPALQAITVSVRPSQMYPQARLGRSPGRVTGPRLSQKARTGFPTLPGSVEGLCRSGGSGLASVTQAACSAVLVSDDWSGSDHRTAKSRAKVVVFHESITATAAN
jgi:hypothetical protein